MSFLFFILPSIEGKCSSKKGEKCFRHVLTKAMKEGEGRLGTSGPLVHIVRLLSKKYKKQEGGEHRERGKDEAARDSDVVRNKHIPRIKAKPF